MQRIEMYIITIDQFKNPNWLVGEAEKFSWELPKTTLEGIQSNSNHCLNPVTLTIIARTVWLWYSFCKVYPMM